MPAGGRLVCSLALGSIAAIGSMMPAGSAEADELTALWVDRGLATEDARALRAAIGAQTHMIFVEAGQARSSLSRMAEQLGEDDREERIARAETDALRAYLHLRFGRAEEAWERGVEAALGSDRAPADPARVSKLVFGRALVRLAAQRIEDAERDLALAMALDPDLAPDRSEYGPPIFRAIEAARRRAADGARAAVTVDRSPEDASVRLDGAELAPGGTVSLPVGSRHLLTAERPGYAPQSRWVTVEEGARVAVVLERATGALLAHQALTLWRGVGGGTLDPTDLTDAAVPLVARALGAERYVVAAVTSEHQVQVALGDSDQERLIRGVRGGRVSWEAVPFAVLAAALDGRTLTAPPPSQVALTVSAPNRVGPGDAIPFRVRLRDPEGRVVRVTARCGEATVALALEEGERGSVGLALDAPDRETTLECLVRALDAEGRALGEPPDPLTVEVTESASTPWYGLWYVWGTAGAIVAAGVVTALLVGRAGDEPVQFLRINGP